MQAGRHGTSGQKIQWATPALGLNLNAGLIPSPIQRPEAILTPALVKQVCLVLMAFLRNLLTYSELPTSPRFPISLTNHLQSKGEFYKCRETAPFRVTLVERVKAFVFFFHKSLSLYNKRSINHFLCLNPKDLSLKKQLNSDKCTWLF